MGLFDDVKQVGSGLASAATGAGRAVKDVGSAVVGAERSAVSTVASGIARVASDVASTAHKVSTYARGSEDAHGSAANTPNQHGVSHAPNAGSGMQENVAKAAPRYDTQIVRSGDGTPQAQTRDTRTGGVVAGYGYGALK